MSFSPEVRKQVLVAAARHCCVCHRYKGVKIEVHHIVQESQGGSNGSENAIALCFDCHADAGHYNPKHPRGIRYSPEELRAARDRWFQVVQQNKILTPTDLDVLYCRYLICRSLGILEEVCRSDFSKIPVTNAMLVANNVLQFQCSIVRSNPYNFNIAAEQGNIFPTKEEYLKVNPDACVIDKKDSEFPYYEAIRIPNKEEFLAELGDTHPLKQKLISGEIQIENFARVLLFKQECGEGTPFFQEDFFIRPIWTVFLAASNISNCYLKLKSLEGSIDTGSTPSLRAFSDRNFRLRSTKRIELPPAPLEPDSTVVIPLLTVFGPLGVVNSSTWCTQSELFDQDEVRQTSHISYEPPALDSFDLIGPSIHPIGFWVEKEGADRFQAMHELDLSNVYTLDRSWAAGSCPHVFFLNTKKGICEYFGEILVGSQGEFGQTTIKVPKQFDTMIIVELEKEEAYIHRILVDKSQVLKRVILREGETVRVRGVQGQLITVEGFYISHSQDVHLRPDPRWRNELVSEYMYAKRI